MFQYMIGLNVPRVCTMAGLVLAAWAEALPGQVGDVSGVTYPGWIPSDRVVPVITTTAVYDAAASVWRYTYVLGNGGSAQQAILGYLMRFNAPGTATLTVPDGWDAFRSLPGTGIAGADFGAILPDILGTSPNGPAPAQIPPGQSLAGFGIVNAYPPGYARTFTKGFAPVPYLPDDWDESTGGVPADTMNALRGFTLGPTRYLSVQTGGNRKPGADGFLGFMNLSVSNSVLISPAPIALKFSLNGETVFRETLRVELNGVNVTAAFKPGPSDGADLVGVFHTGLTPLKSGKNILLTSVEGIPVGSTQRSTDADRITFYIDQTRAQGGKGSNALDNSPDPQPCTGC